MILKRGLNGFGDLVPLGGAELVEILGLDGHLGVIRACAVGLDSSVAARSLDGEELPVAFGFAVEQLDGQLFEAVRLLPAKWANGSKVNIGEGLMHTVDLE